MTHEFNPYQAPGVSAKSADHSLSEAASKSRRFSGFVIDYACFIACAGLVGLACGYFFGEAGMQALAKIPEFFVGSVIYAAYFLFFEGIWARSPGKMMLGMLVVTDAGTRAEFGHILKRTACRIIPFDAFSFLGKKGWHDSLSATTVVRIGNR